MKIYRALLLVIMLLSACAPSPEEQATQMAMALTATADAWTETSSPTATAIPSQTLTPTATQTLTPTVTLTPSITPSPTISPTPTFSFPTVRVNKQAHCRYGPSVAYLHAADLYAGDTGTVRGRYIYSGWLYVRFDRIPSDSDLVSITHCSHIFGRTVHIAPDGLKVKLGVVDRRNISHYIHYGRSNPACIIKLSNFYLKNLLFVLLLSSLFVMKFFLC